MEHLKYCLREILIIKALVDIKNCSFYKRSLSRLLAVRTDDFIKIAFKLNKDTLNSQAVKDDLNAFQTLYKDYFKVQRDKYGAHFQELELSKRLDLWSQMDWDRTIFFSSTPAEIYAHFSSVNGYQDVNVLFPKISNELVSKITELNIEMDIEKYPNFSSDILSLTRYNSGGIIPASRLQTKAGVLKSLEIILDYDISLCQLTRTDSSLTSTVKKLLITDIVSYCDNFITRSDLPNDAPQEESGLDKLIDEAGFIQAHKIIADFKNNFKFQTKLDELRFVRNLTCGHIDVDTPIHDHQSSINSIPNENIKRFYEQIKKTFKQICYAETTFRMFLLEPKDKMHGVHKLVGMPVRPFDINSIPQIEFINPDVNDVNEYDKKFQVLSDVKSHEEARQYFWTSFNNSTIVERVSHKSVQNGFERIANLDITRAHIYFREKLNNPKVSSADKIKIVQLFISCQNGHPQTLLYILLETYHLNRGDQILNRNYLFAFGELSRVRDEQIFKILSANYDEGGFYKSYYSLLSIFKLDIKSRQGHIIDIDLSETSFSQYVKKTIDQTQNPFFKIAYVLGLVGELNYSLNLAYKRTVLDKLYNSYFESILRSALRSYLSPLISDNKDEEKVNNAMEAFSLHRFSTFIAVLGNFLEQKNEKKAAREFRILLTERIVKFASNDNMELHNFAIVNFQLNNIDQSVEIANYLIEKNPTDPSFYFLLLNIYLKDKKYLAKFAEYKSYVLENFNLPEDNRKEFEKLEYA